MWDLYTINRIIHCICDLLGKSGLQPLSVAWDHLLLSSQLHSHIWGDVVVNWHFYLRHIWNGFMMRGWLITMTVLIRTWPSTTVIMSLSSLSQPVSRPNRDAASSTEGRLAYWHLLYGKIVGASSWVGLSMQISWKGLNRNIAQLSRSCLFALVACWRQAWQLQREPNCKRVPKSEQSLDRLVSSWILKRIPSSLICSVLDSF